jgi:tetratricopeptide (TPR) repeat protein
LANFKNSGPHLGDFAQTYPDHPLSSTAAYLAAWSYARRGDYANGQRWAGRSADLSGTAKAEDSARARYLQGVLLAYASDWQAALAALETAQALRDPRGQRTTYTVKAALERARVFAQAGQVDLADGAYLAVQRDFADDPLAETAAFERGQMLYQAKRWAPGADALASYRQAFPKGRFVEGALYFGALCQQSLGKIDGAILLWERQLKDFPGGQYRLPAALALGAAYWEKQDWSASFRVYTDALAEFGERAKTAGVQDRVEMLRYLMAQVPEKAARFQVILNREHGTATSAGRAAALGLARFYINESPQREAALPLLEEVTALAKDDPASAAEAYLLEGDYYTLLERWDQGAQAYLRAVSTGTDIPATARTTEGQSIKTDLIPEALFKAARSRLRSGKKDSAQTVVTDLARLYPSSPWTAQAKKLMENRP